MKSTGLFGKNSGKVGGVVYSNYRGEQIVRSYQPQVKNPNTIGQVAQRAKFKLVSQISAELSNELRSFTPRKNETPRNAWVSKMLRKARFNTITREATLPLEDVILTNQHYGEIVYSQNVGLRLYGFGSAVRVRDVVLAYNEEGEIIVYSSADLVPQDTSANNKIVQLPAVSPSPSYSNYRRIVYAYDYKDQTTYSAYEDYLIENDDATLSVIQNEYSSGLAYSESLNLAVNLGV